MAQFVFWFSLLSVLYVYAGYPLLLMAWQRFFPRPVRKQPYEPTVSIVIAMHNEAADAESRIRNCFQLDYPADKLEIVVSLDAPTDGTDELLSAFRSEKVVIVTSTLRRGKAAALNAGVARASGDIVVFADARQRFERRAIRELVANFADDSIGVVSGQLVILDAQGRESGDAAGLYWRYEKAIRAMESNVHSVPGATGAIYAIRRELYSPLPPKTILDDVLNSLRVVLRGKRAIFESEARAYDVATPNLDIEYKRKRRTLMGNYQLLIEHPVLLLPWRNPIFLQLVSHKAGRLVVPYCLVALFVSNLFLLHGFYGLFFACQAAWYLLAVTGKLIASNESARRPAWRRLGDSL